MNHAEQRLLAYCDLLLACIVRFRQLSHKAHETPELASLVNSILDLRNNISPPAARVIATGTPAITPL